MAAAALQRWYQQQPYLPFSIEHPKVIEGAFLIHGLLGSPAEMRPLAELVVTRGLDAHVPLIPGMAAEVDRFHGVTSREWIDRLHAEWDAFAARYERRVLVGYSLGGALALRLAESVGKPPDLIVLLAPFTRIANRNARFLPVIKRFMRDINFFARMDLDDPGVRDWFERTLPGLNLDDTAVVESMREDATMAMETVDQMRKLGAEVFARAHEVNIPTLVIQGNRDRVVLPRDTRRLVSELPRLWAYHEIPGDHMLPYPTFDSWSAVSHLVDHAVASWMGSRA